MITQTQLAWHFLPDDGFTRYPPRQKVVVGEWLQVDPARLQLCEYGLHASTRIIDALQHAPGALLCRVEVRGLVLTGSDKVCASQRRVIAMADATDVLREIACWSAESVIGNISDVKARALAQTAIDTGRLYVVGKATAAQLSAAWSSAKYASWSSPESVARYAIWNAAESASRHIGDTDVDWAATWQATWYSINTHLTALATELLGL